MPIVDDPETFGRIAATNAISDVYAMGGTPLMAIAILGWPISSLSPEVAGLVVRGAQAVCKEAGIPLAGGHSIDAPEPIFGLAVTGKVRIADIKKNGGAKAGDILMLTKPLGVGIFSTAQKQGKLLPQHEKLSIGVMTRLNVAGERLGKISGVTAMTDVTGFGLAGHLIEMCRSSNCSAEIQFDSLPLIDNAVFDYVADGCIPGGTNRNFESYGRDLSPMEDLQKIIVCDPQTSGGLLIAVDPESLDEVQAILEADGLCFNPIGAITERTEYLVVVR
jgi:selenide,water dikinase